MIAAAVVGGVATYLSSHTCSSSSRRLPCEHRAIAIDNSPFSPAFSCKSVRSRTTQIPSTRRVQWRAVLPRASPNSAFRVWKLRRAPSWVPMTIDDLSLRARSPERTKFAAWFSRRAVSGGGQTRRPPRPERGRRPSGKTDVLVFVGTPRPHVGKGGAGEGNRTLVISLEGCCSTIELHPHRGPAVGIKASDTSDSVDSVPHALSPVPSMESDGGGGRTRTYEAIRRLIYSQLPLPLGTLPRSEGS